jgi:hypothetical protein
LLLSLFLVFIRYSCGLELFLVFIRALLLEHVLFFIRVALAARERRNSDFSSSNSRDFGNSLVGGSSSTNT